MTENKSNLDLVVVIDNVRSAYNVGTIFRTSDGSGASKIYLCGISPCPPSHKISKVALGAENYIPWEKVSQTWRLLDKLHQENYFIITLEQGEKAQNIFTFRP